MLRHARIVGEICVYHPTTPGCRPIEELESPDYAFGDAQGEPPLHASSSASNLSSFAPLLFFGGAAAVFFLLTWLIYRFYGAAIRDVFYLVLSNFLSWGRFWNGPWIADVRGISGDYAVSFTLAPPAESFQCSSDEYGFLMAGRMAEDPPIVTADKFDRSASASSSTVSNTVSITRHSNVVNRVVGRPRMAVRSPSEKYYKQIIAQKKQIHQARMQRHSELFDLERTVLNDSIQSARLKNKQRKIRDDMEFVRTMAFRVYFVGSLVYIVYLVKNTDILESALAESLTSLWTSFDPSNPVWVLRVAVLFGFPLIMLLGFPVVTLAAPILLWMAPIFNDLGLPLFAGWMAYTLVFIFTHLLAHNQMLRLTMPVQCFLIFVPSAFLLVVAMVVPKWSFEIFLD